MSTDGPASANRIRENWCELVESVKQSAQLAGRSASEIRIVGVTKYVTADQAKALVHAGCRQLGESRPQSLWEKSEALRVFDGIQWHMIGHLQRNKLRKTLPLIHCLHSLDNLRLAQSLDAELATQPQRRPLPCLVEVNVTQDTTKTGLPPTELPKFLEQLATLKRINVLGLMAMSTLHATSQQIRREFAQVRELLLAMKIRFDTTHELSQLSMGMSDDYREAIAEGATILRIGSTIWKGVEP